MMTTLNRLFYQAKLTKRAKLDEPRKGETIEERVERIKDSVVDLLIRSC